MTTMVDGETPVSAFIDALLADAPAYAQHHVWARRLEGSLRLTPFDRGTTENVGALAQEIATEIESAWLALEDGY